MGELIGNHNLNLKFETKTYKIVLEFTGFDSINSLMLHFFSMIKTKRCFLNIVGDIKKKNQILRNMIKNKANKFRATKVLIKSTVKRLSFGKIAFFENLSQLKLINFNYFSRALLEKKLIKKIFLNSNFETFTFYYYRIINLKNTTRSDRNSLQKFLKTSTKKEQKIVLRTLCRVKKVKILSDNRILGICSNSYESFSFFISFKLYHLSKDAFKGYYNCLPQIYIHEIISLKTFCHFYLKRLKKQLKRNQY